MWSWSDRLAVALACIGAAMALVLFLVEKTPLTTGVTLACIAALLIYPILHFIPSRAMRVVAVLVLVLLVCLFGWHVWPHKEPVVLVPTTAPASAPITAPATIPSQPLVSNPTSKPVMKQPLHRGEDQKLSKTALNLAAKIRKLSQDWKTEQSKIDNASDVTDQQRKQMGGTWATKVMAEYDSTYKVDARMVHDRLLAKLPPGTDPLAMKDLYENEVNPGLLETIASDLERLAKLLPTPGNGEALLTHSGRSEVGIKQSGNGDTANPGTSTGPVYVGNCGVFQNGGSNNSANPNCLPPERKLSSDSRKAFVDSLRPACPFDVPVHALSGNPEASRYSDQIMNALRDAGCNPTIPTNILDSGSLYGIGIQVPDLNNIPPHVLALEKGLQSAFISFTPFAHPMGPDVEFYLVVGFQDPPQQ
jgi:hypothetical protein